MRQSDEEWKPSLRKPQTVLPLTWADPGLHPLNHYTVEKKLLEQKTGRAAFTFPSVCSAREKASMKACAITDKQPSICEVFLMSKTNWGFFSMFTQKRRGRLDRERKSIFKLKHSDCATALKWPSNCTASTFLGCLFMLKKRSLNKGYRANTSVSHASIFK